MLKIKPFEEYVGSDPVICYVGIRADENREGYITRKSNIKTVFPFKEDGIVKADVFRILEEAGLGLPDYYKWRTRSGCYFCFFQRKTEWAGLLEKHPELYAKAQAYEKFDKETGKQFTWQQEESLTELAQPERITQIKKKEIRRLELIENQKNRYPLLQKNLFDDDDDDDDDDDEKACTICSV